MLKNICFRLILVLCSFTLCVLAAEVFLRYTNPQIHHLHTAGLYQSHPSMGYSLAPEFSGKLVSYHPGEFTVNIRTNSSGLRDVEYAEKAPNACRILVLGDSFTWGSGVTMEETYPKVLERLLRKRYKNILWEVINAGVGGYSTLQELVYLKEEGSIHKPDLVILGFFARNDVMDNIVDLEERFIVENGYLIDTYSYKKIQKTIPFTVPFDSHLRRYSHLYLLMRNRYYTWWVKRNAANDDRSINLDSFLIDPTARVALAWEHTKNTIRQMQIIADENRSHFLVIIIPSKEQVFPPSESKGQFDWQIPSTHLLRLTGDSGIPVIDLFPFFQKSHNRGHYFAHDTHWTAKGHAFAAEKLFDAMENRGLITKLRAAIR